MNRSRAINGFLIAAIAFAIEPTRSQDLSPPPDARWGEVKAHLHLGWSPLRSEIRQGEPVVLTVRMRMVDRSAVPVRVVSTGMLDPFSIGVFYGAKREPVGMTGEGLAILHPDGYIATRGSYMGINSIITREIALGDWWDLSRPGQYMVTITHRQRLPGRSDEYTMIRAPDVTFRVVGK